MAKDIDEYNGGSDLMWNMAQYVERKPKKFSVSMCKMYITVSDALNLWTVIKLPDACVSIDLICRELCADVSIS